MKTNEDYKAKAFFKVEGDPNIMKMKAEMVMSGIIEGSKEDAAHLLEMYRIAFEGGYAAEKERNERLRRALRDEGGREDITEEWTRLQQSLATVDDSIVSGYLRWKDEFRREVVFVPHEDGPFKFNKSYLPAEGNSLFIAPEPE